VIIYLIKTLSMSTITNAMTNKMNGKYTIKPSTAVAVQYFFTQLRL